MRVEGVEPTCLAAPDPKSGASANFAIPAFEFKGANVIQNADGKTDLRKILQVIAEIKKPPSNLPVGKTPNLM